MHTTEAYGPAGRMMSSRLRFMFFMCLRRRRVTLPIEQVAMKINGILVFD